LPLETPIHPRGGALRRRASQQTVEQSTSALDTGSDRAARSDPARRRSRSLDVVGDRLAPHPATTRQPSGL